MTSVRALGGYALAGAGVSLAANAIMKGENATTDFTSKSSLIQYGIAIGGTAAIGAVAPSLFYASRSGQGAINGGAIGVASLAGWAVGEVLSRHLEI